MRVGNNPLKGKLLEYDRPEVVVAVTTHLPELVGYHASRLEIVQTSLISMREHMEMAAEIYVWDNGSCAELREWLLDDFRPDYLTLSANIGKCSARKSILRSFEPDTIIAYADDDMLYYPNWLRPQIDLLEQYPNVGVVTGYPVRTSFRWGIRSNLRWAQGTPEVTVAKGRLLPQAWEDDHAASIGRSPGQHAQLTKADFDLRFTYRGLSAFATAHHCQFVGYAGRIEPVCNWRDEAMHDERKFDQAIDDCGYLRLATVERLTRHMGNVMDDDLRAECARMGVLHGEQLRND